MNILLPTYGYYPYNWGGTEVYVSGLAKYLTERGHTVTIIASMPPEAFNDHIAFYEDDQLKTIKYDHESVSVIGVVLKNETTEEIYKKFRKSWVISWQNVLIKHSAVAWDILHTHANTSAIGEALMTAAKKNSPALKLVASYHVPVSCVKGTLLFGNGMRACSVKPAPNICTACFISSKQNLPLHFAKIISGVIPKLKNEKLSTSLKLKSLVAEFITSFKSFDSRIDQWHVFSEQIKNVLLLNNVEQKKILLLRHGVNPCFHTDSSQSVPERKSTGKTVFLYAGRFHKVKGFFTLLKAWYCLPDNDVRELWIIGDLQNSDTEWQRWQAGLTQRKDIKWLGVKTQNDIASLMRLTHCIIIPSEWIEIGPLVFHEAIAAGSDVLASNMGGCKELAEFYSLKSNLFEAGNHVDLSKKITEFKYSGKELKVASSNINYHGVLKSYIQLTGNPQVIKI